MSDRSVKSVLPALIVLLGMPVLAGAQDAAPAPMLASLYDTTAASAEALSGAAIESRTGWVAVKEEDLTHAFQGDAVLVNDRLALVLRKGGTGAESYALSSTGAWLRAVLSPKSAKGIQSLEVIENTPAAVAVRATFGSEGGRTLAVAYRITVGQITIQMKPGEGVDALNVAAQTDYLVVPDFFADDLVYVAQSAKGASLGLPAENFYLHLSGGGSTILTCVWQTTGRGARALFAGEGAQRALTGSEIDCAPGKLVWVAIAERPDLWHSTTVTASDTATLSWAPPFPAKWRGNFATASEVSRSFGFLEQKASNYPCWFDGGAAHVSLPKGIPAEATPLVIYPIDRSQATPLDVFVLVDVMRGTLGVGPCQYVLDLEGLDAQSSPTPALVLEWIEKLFKKKRVEKNADAIRAKLAAMQEHIDEANARINEYAAFAAKLNSSETARPIVAEMESAIKDSAPRREAQVRVKELSDLVAGLVGREDWATQFEPARDELCAIGSAQDRTLSTCRMALRRLKQRCLEQGPVAAEAVKQIDVMLGESGAA